LKLKYDKLLVTIAFKFNLRRYSKAGNTGICLNVNPARYVDMGGWIGGQAEYVMVPYADFNLLKFPDKEQAREKIESLTLLSDIFPTGRG